MLLLLLFISALLSLSALTILSLSLFVLYNNGFIQPNEPAEWKGLPDPLLRFACKAIAFFLPYEVVLKEETVKLLETMKDKKEQKVFFVCNHQLGALEVPVLISAIYLQTGIYPRSLMDRLHFMVPLYSQICTLGGGILADRELCAKAMNVNAPLLVFPGGSKEVLRSKASKAYTLQWGDRRGFARMALAHGYTIVPVSSIGADEQFEVLFDVDMSPLMKMIGDKRAKSNTPLPIFVPRFNFQKQYVRLNNPIDTTAFKKEDQDLDAQGQEDAICKIRDETRDEIEAGFEFLKKRQAEDPNRFPSLRRLLSV